jgi:RimJ/RimL family protein N-acetyltransferase
MRQNYETCIVGSKCVLVPYRPCHVDKYHEWMKQPFLLEMTGSEPLSLKEEVDMQQSWRDDKHKCTFIVLAKEKCVFLEYASNHGDPEFCQRNIHAMVGDVNLFFSEEEKEPEDEHQSAEYAESVQVNKPQQLQLEAELDIMIAEEDFRGKGLGKEASCLMMLYGTKAKNIRRFFCKIKETNHASLALFQNKLGFQQCAYAACFQEHELQNRQDSSQLMQQKLQLLLGGNTFPWTTFHCPIFIPSKESVDQDG